MKANKNRDPTQPHAKLRPTDPKAKAKKQREIARTLREISKVSKRLAKRLKETEKRNERWNSDGATD